MTPSKILIFEAFISKLRKEMDSLLESAKSAHLAATHEESKAEDRHDTFAIEASYLAAGHSARIRDLEQALKELEGFRTGTPARERVALGSVVTYETRGRIHHVLFARHAGGARIEIEGTHLQIISDTSPLGEVLFQARPGEEIEFELRGSVESLKILRLT